MGAFSAILASMVMVIVMLSPEESTGHVMNLSKRVPTPLSSSTLSLRQHFEQAVVHDRARHPRMFDGIVNFPIFGNPDPHSLGEYYITLYLGTPRQEFHLQHDTGSDISWVAYSGCMCCPVSTSIDIHQNLFNVSSSATARVVPCSSHVCTSTVQYSDRCYYEISYQDGSATVGYYLTDLLQFDAIAPKTIFHYSDSVVFGCSINESGRLSNTFNVLDDIVGFGQGKVSLISQLAYKKITPGIFSHCLKGDGNGTKYSARWWSPESSTPLLPVGPHYNVDLRSISVNGQIVFAMGSTQQTIVDSGSTYSYLVREIYDALVNGFKKDSYAVAKYYVCEDTLIALIIRNEIDGPPSVLLSYPNNVSCHTFSDSRTQGKRSVNVMPSVTLNFSGGSSMALTMEGYLIYFGFNVLEGAHLWSVAFQIAQCNILGGSLSLNISTTYSGVSTAAVLTSNGLFFLSVCVLFSFALVHS